MLYCTSFLIFLLTLISQFLINTYAEESNSEHTDDYVPRFFGGRLSSQGTPTTQRRRSNSRHRSMPSVKTLNFTQKLDHFDPNSTLVWEQRYFVNDTYFKPRPNGPIFIILGGEARMEPYQVTDGPMVRLAKKYEALVLGLEHRFYGDSRPTKDTSAKNLRFLSSQQALADLNNFITVQKRKYKCKNPSARIVLYGCSYSGQGPGAITAKLGILLPGSLAAYFTEQYPENKARAIAAFAPMVAMENFERTYIDQLSQSYFKRPKCEEELSLLAEYFEGVNQAIDVQDPSNTKRIGCKNSLLSAFYHIADLVNEGNNEKLNAALNLCEPKVLNYSNPNAIDSLTYEILSIVMIKAQYNNVQLGENSELSSLCTIMTQRIYHCKCYDMSAAFVDLPKDTLLFYPACCELEKYVSWLNQVDGTCLIHNGAGIAAKSVGWNSKYVMQGTRQWLWQMCTEWGYFTPTPRNFFWIQGLKISLEYMKKTCKESFGISNTTENIQRTNEYYGKLSGKERFRNVYFLQSMADPWSRAFDEFSQTAAAGVITMETISHCYEPIGDDSDPKELTNAWMGIDNAIQKWFRDDDIEALIANTQQAEEAEGVWE